MHADQADRPILVGYDDSPESRDALRWAVEEARLRRVSVLVCHALHWPYAPRPVAEEVLTQIEQVALAVVDEGVRRAKEPAPEVDVQPVLGKGTPAAVLLEVASGAVFTEFVTERPNASWSTRRRTPRSSSSATGGTDLPPACCSARSPRPRCSNPGARSR
ncbi:universal stress protein [Nonomuraea sp. NPDC003560]|uniref:universal stress protein n=1 Tax=Nonomuraea sp. NPDC003560 TaxID=3364341 RepID=UPI00368CED1F